jgi:cytoskeletal protein CcmA (bactofilin family)
MPLFRREPSGSAATGSTATPQGTAGDAAAGAARRGAASAMTVVAAGTKLTGEVGGATDVQVDGEVAGRVSIAATVVVGAGGTVRGPIEAQVVRIVGQVIGDVSASERVEVGAAASLEGDIAAPRVVIAEGAFFKGKIDMKGEKNREPRRPQSSPKSGGEAPKAAADAGSK